MNEALFGCGPVWAKMLETKTGEVERFLWTMIPATSVTSKGTDGKASRSPKYSAQWNSG